MRYGTLTGGQPVPAPNPLRRGLNVIFNPPGEAYEEAGYLPIVETPYPDVSDLDTAPYYTPSWVELGGQIVRVWTESAPPEPAPEQPDKLTQLEMAVAELGARMDEQNTANQVAIAELADAMLGGGADG